MRCALSLLILLFVTSADAFDSGSTGADGALTPNVDTEIPLPPNGVFNYTEINIPAGVTVTFTRNALNTPATLLVSGDATIDGVINVSGAAGADTAGAGDGSVGDDGVPGQGGPGGFRGGDGGMQAANGANGGPRTAQAGVGPGGGRPCVIRFDRADAWQTAGGAFASGSGHFSTGCGVSSAPTYGNEDLLPMVGGSGGSGGFGSASTRGGGGGGGGGALLIAVTGTLTVNGTIAANGGNGAAVGHNRVQNTAQAGGAGSGGGIRLVATTLTGNGPIAAVGGNHGVFANSIVTGTRAGNGRIRFEADSYQRTAGTSPAFTLGQPGDLGLVSPPSLRIASVAGVDAPVAPTGNADIVLPATITNPVQLVVESTNVPVGNTVNVIVTPPAGTPNTVVSSALTGTEASANAVADIDLQDGHTVLLATLSFSVAGTPKALAYSRYTEGEPVMAVELAAALGGAPQTILITESGRRIVMPPVSS